MWMPVSNLLWTDFWHDRTWATFASVKWRDPCTGLRKGSDPVLIRGWGHAYSFSQDENKAWWLSVHLVHCVEHRMLALIILWLLMLPQRIWNEMCWTYVPDPPILYPGVWEGEEITVIVKHSQLLDRPTEAVSQSTVSINYSGSGWGMPICFSKNDSVTKCLAIYPHLGYRGHLCQYIVHLLLK